MNAPLDDREGFAAFLLRMRGRGLDERNLMTAIEATPRHEFVPGQWREAVWGRRMIPIDCGEAIEGLDLQAQVLASLGVERGHRVLEIGTGSGFTAAVLGRMTQKVISLERYRLLAEQARSRLQGLGLNGVVVRQADGAEGLAAEGPYDRIVVWAAFESLPRVFVDQLSTNGVMIAPIGPPEGEQALARLVKIGSRFDRQDIALARLQPIVRGVAARI